MRSFTILLVLLAVSTAHASTRADELLWKCNGTGDDETDAMLGKLACASYLSGFLDAYTITTYGQKSNHLICLPDRGISNDQTIRIVVKFLEDHPEDLHESARSMVFVALQAAFPCRADR